MLGFNWLFKSLKSSKSYKLVDDDVLAAIMKSLGGISKNGGISKFVMNTFHIAASKDGDKLIYICIRKIGRPENYVYILPDGSIKPTGSDFLGNNVLIAYGEKIRDRLVPQKA